MQKLQLSALVAALVPLAWLLPNHYLPWAAAWLEGLALAVIAIAALLTWRRPAVPWPWAAAILLALASVAGQFAFGHIPFAGDALMSAFYLMALLAALMLGHALTAPARDGAAPIDFPELLALTMLVGAILSVAIALAQWVSVPLPGLSMAPMPPGSRPFANVAQPNHFCTIAFLGLCSLALLREAGRLNTFSWWLAAGFLIVGMVISGSRTGWLQIGVLAAATGLFAARQRLRVHWRVALGLVLLLAALHPAKPVVERLLGVEATRSVAEQLQAGTRPGHWTLLADAVWRERWTGYGWLQVGRAQQAAAPDHPPVIEHLDYAHNLVLDVLLWAGIPIGGSILVLIFLGLARQWTRIHDPRAFWLFVGVLGVGAHSMLEYPHSYAYFLLPVGMAVGAMHALSARANGAFGRRGWPVATLPALGALVAAVLTVVATDYLEAESNHRALRLEAAKIGVDRIVTPAPQLRVLDQLQAFLEFARTEARPGMTPAELDRMRTVSERFGFPPVLLRHALASGLNGRPEEAARALVVLCKVHPAARCDEGRDAWRSMVERYPMLRSIPLP